MILAAALLLGSVAVGWWSRQCCFWFSRATVPPA
jgi:hypothetical protein